MTARSLFLFGSAALTAGLVSTPAHAETVLRYSTITGGGIVATGNALGLAKQLDQNGPGTEDSIGTFMTLDAGEVDDLPLNAANPWPAGTTADWTVNGSEATLVLPLEAEVLYAELVWGGSWGYGGEDVSDNLDDDVILSANGESLLATPDGATAQTIEAVSSAGFALNYYLRSADVTDFVIEHADSVYAVEGVPATQNELIDEVNAAGWSLLVVYRNSAEPIRNLTVYVGGEFVDEDAVVDYEVSGFCTPPSGAFEGYAAVSAVEGDADREGDSLTIAETQAGPFVTLVGDNNPADNFFCSQINDFNGDLDTSGTFGDNNHDAIGGNNVIGGRQGWDVTTVPISSQEGHLTVGQTEAVLRAETQGDSFLPTAAGLAIEVNAPDFTGASAGVEPQLIAIDQTATASISMENVGLVDATGLTFTAELPAGLSLDSFSINGTDGDIDGAPVTTADLASGVSLGDVMVGVAIDIEMVVVADAAPDNGMNWEIQPRWDYDYVSCAGEDPLTEPHSTETLTINFEAVEGGGSTTGGDEGLDETAGEDDDADQGGEDDDADQGNDDETDATGDDGTSGLSASGGMAVSDDSGCGCQSSAPAPAWMLGLFAMLGLVRRRRT